ncbi:pseudaminic acid synthase [uncultured Erythrobacter sp.]|uniref:pseudaminic acid synthase n=1 Tax=uncultured Erythrobacter sp. TaxID=263913 RepID=UPI00261CFAFB|nr:pseudaminic acid synthase [uncultured Erythrobacter sp.]
MSQSVIIAGRPIDASHPPYLIAEMSANHNNSLERALAIVDAAAGAGAHAIKLQTYTADTMTLDCDRPGFVIDDPASLWHGRHLHELYDEAHLPWEWHTPIFARAAERGIACLSSPFDESAVAFLEELGTPAYKIASFELVDLPLIRAVARTGKPMIMSTGMATPAEIDEAVRTARGCGNDQIVLLKCTSTYPASAENTNISTIPHLRAMSGCEVGLSDHTMGCGVAVAATALGAVLVEKHFTLSRADGGVDSEFSMEPAELAQLREETERAWQAVGQVRYGDVPSEDASRTFRRSLYITRDLAAGEVIDESAIRSIRPGFGLAPKHLGTLIGKRVSQDVARGTPASWDLVG